MSDLNLKFFFFSNLQQKKMFWNIDFYLRKTNNTLEIRYQCMINLYLAKKSNRVIYYFTSFLKLYAYNDVNNVSLKTETVEFI